MRKEKIIEFNNLLSYASKFLTKETYEHSLRVVLYVMCNDAIPEEIHDDCIVAAIAHDLIEDGSIGIGELPHPLDDRVVGALDLLTKREKQHYVDYIKEIKECAHTADGKIAYWVKMADMKDHLAQRATLTDRLKEKYLEALPFLLP